MKLWLDREIEEDLNDNEIKELERAIISHMFENVIPYDEYYSLEVNDLDLQILWYKLANGQNNVSVTYR